MPSVGIASPTMAKVILRLFGVCQHVQIACFCIAGVPKTTPVGFEAAFGPLKAARKGAGAEGSKEIVARSGAAAEGQASVQELWDAPSHALLPLSVLAGPSLEAMLSGLSH